MPHPTSPAAPTPEQDDRLPDAPVLCENGGHESDEDHKVALTEGDQMDIEPTPRPEGLCLDNIFDDEDDEFPASSAPETKPEVATDVPMYVRKQHSHSGAEWTDH
jgi:hypothetical protein